MGLSHAPRVITDGLVLGLDAANTRSYVGSGTTWTDLIGSNNGTLTNGPVFTQEPKLEPFGGAGAVEFDGTGDYLSIADSDSFTFGSEDFTVECWVYNQDSGNRKFIIGQSNSNGQNVSISFSLYKTSGNKLEGAVCVDANFYNITSPTDLPSNTWVHCAFVRNGTTTNLYMSGILQGTSSSVSTSSINDSSNQLSIGRLGEYNQEYWNGYISNLRILKGTALYTSNFTPPRKKLEATSDTVLLTCEKGTIKDRSPSAHAITINGDAKSISGASYFEFDGTNDYITTNTNANFTLGASEDFALEWWEYWTLTSPTTMHGHVGVFDNGCLHIASYTGNQQFAMHYGTWYYFANAYVVPSQWTHYVVTGQSQNIRFYQNGELKSTNTGSNYTVSGTPGATKYFEVGRNTYGSTGYSEMKVSSVKFYKGKSFTEDEVQQNFNALRGRYGI